MNRNIRSRALAFVTTSVLLACSGGAAAQSIYGPRAAPPPSYGPPTAASLQGHEATVFSNGFSFQLRVDAADLLRFLPAGYTAVTISEGSPIASITGIFATQSTFTLRTAVGGFLPGSYGPYDSFDLVAGAIPPGGTTPESVVIARFVNNVEIADARNALYGVGTTRYADIDIRTRLSIGQREMTGRVHDETLGFRIVAKQTGLDQTPTTLRNFVFPLPLRVTNFAQFPPVAGVATNSTLSGDQTVTLTDPLALELGAARIKIGDAPKLQVLEGAPGLFFLNQERHHKIR